ncbi:MAG: VanZ family protein [Candidatus Omnitrophota bacterium]
MSRKFLAYWLPLYLYAGLIFYISSIPKPLPDISIPYIDKFLHALEYAVFGGLAARAFRNSKKEALRENFKVLAVIAALVYGASDEFHQYFVSSRACDCFDLISDFIGGTIGAIIYGRYYRFQRHAL